MIVPTQYQCGAPAEKSRLDRVEMRTKVGGVSQTVRGYSLSYDYSTFPGVWHQPTGQSGRLTLKTITPYGTEGPAGPTLPTTTFTYQANRLSQVANGIGGSVSFNYDQTYFPYNGGFTEVWDFFNGNTGPWAVEGDLWARTGEWGGQAALFISSGSGYVAFRPQSFIPGGWYAFDAEFHVDETVRIKWTVVDCPSERVMVDWTHSPHGAWFLLSPQAACFEIRMYVADGTVAIPLARTTIAPTYSRVISRSLSDGASASLWTYAYVGGAVREYPGTSRFGETEQFIGHQQVTVTDPTGAQTETQFHQDEVKLGRPSQITQQGYGQTYSRVLNTYGTRSIPVYQMAYGDRSDFVYLQESRRQTYDAQSTFKEAKSIFDYDGYGNLARTDEYDDQAALYRRTVKTYTYNPSAWIVDKVASVEIQLPNGTAVGKTRYCYDNAASCAPPVPTPSQGALTRVEATANGTDYFPQARNVYDAYGNIVGTTDARGNTTTTQYDAAYHLFPLVITNTLGHVTTNAYNVRLGKLASTQDPNGATTSYDYDAVGRTLSVRAPYEQGHAATAMYTYTLGSPRSRVQVSVRQDLGGANTPHYLHAWWFYDGLGRVIQQQRQGANNTLIVVDTEYDSLGRLKSTTNPYDPSQTVPIVYTYSALAPAVKGGAGGAAPTPTPTPVWTAGTFVETPFSKPKTQYEYDPVGRTTCTIFADNSDQTYTYNQWLTTIVDANGRERQQRADFLGRTIEVKERIGTTWYPTTYAYDTRDRLQTITDSANNTTTMNYDWLGRKIDMDDPDLGYWTYGYDDAGNLTTQTDARECVTTLAYDAMNRLTGKSYSDPGVCGTASSVSFGYDAYDGVNQFGRGRRTSMSDATGNTSWVFDKQGRVKTETDIITGAPAPNYVTSWTYDAMDRVRTMTYPDGEGVTSTYNDQGQLATFGTYVTGSTYEISGQLRSYSLGDGTSVAMTYHPQNLRMTSLKAIGGASPMMDLAYAYDAVGNITRITYTDTLRSEVSTFGYDDLDRLTSASLTGGDNPYTASWVYNPIGNITQRTQDGTPTPYTYGDAAHKHAVTAAGGQTFGYDANGSMTSRAGGTLTYDAENRLREVVAGGVTTNYAYNGAGRRVTRAVTSGGATTTTYYVGNYYEVELPSGTTTKYYYFGSQRVALKRGETVTYLYSDHLGSTALTRDSSRGTLARQWYSPYGTVRLTEGTLPTDYTFTGQKQDSYINLIQTGVRWYDPYLNRWTQPDTIIPDVYNPQSLNRYTYAYNNPVRFYDSDGHCFPFCQLATYAALRAMPRELAAAGSRFVANQGIPVVSDLAKLDAANVDNLWLAVNGDQVGLSAQERLGAYGTALVGQAVEGTLLYVGLEAATGIGSVASTCLATGCVGRAGAPEQVTSASRALLDSVSKADAKAAIRAGMEGLSKAQGEKLLDKLNSGRIDKFTVTMVENGSVQATAERAGAASGFQRIIWTIDPSGNVVKAVQNAYNDAGELIHVHDWIDDLIIQ